MYKIQNIRVTPKLPKELAYLRELAYNLYWSWDHNSRALFRRLNDDLWEDLNRNPILMLGSIDQERLEQLAQNEGYLAFLEHVKESVDSYMTRKMWYQENYGDRDDFTIACPGIRLNRGSPRSMETWPMGGSRQILWTPLHMPDTATVRIELRRGPYIYTIARGVPANRDYYDWDVGTVLDGVTPPPPGEQYYIMILQEGCERVFGSSPEFTFE